MLEFRSRKREQRLSTTRWFPSLLAAICVMLVATVSAFAQGSRGTINGEVTDPQGAVVAGATVKLIKPDTKQEIRTTTTNESGLYQFLEIEPGTYEVVVTATGFNEARLKEVALEPNRVVRLDTKLTVGGATEEVTVTAAQEILDRETPTIGTTVEGRRVEGLPLNGRNILDLALGQPGVTTVAVAPGGTGTVPFGAGLGIRTNGQRGTENNVTLDGANNNEVAVGGSTGFQPRPDAVQEFRLLTSNYEAEFGRNTGSVITVVTKSGSNDFHGNVRFFYRPTVLSAARFFDQNEPGDLPRAGTKDDFRRRFERKEGGFNIGGPVYLPRFGEGGRAVHSGKDKTFFFFDWERRGQLVGATQTVTNLPTAAERSGQFDHTIIDPATGAPFPGNRIPAERISPIARYYLQFLPLPSSASGTATVGANEIENFDIITARADHIINNAQSLNFTVNWFDRTDDTPFAFGGANVPGFGALDLRTTTNLVLRHTWSLSPTLVNSFLAGYARNNQPSVAPANKDSAASIGFSPSFTVLPQFAGPPNVRLLDRNLILGNSIQGPQARVAENFQIQDSVSWSHGNHRFKFGFDGTKYKQDQLFLFINQGIISYASGNGGNDTGDDLADLLIGTSPTALQLGSNGERDFRQTAYALFGQDNWRVRNNLTLSLGLRYEYNSPLTDARNRVAYYRPGAVSSLLTSGFRGPDGVFLSTGGGRAPRGLVYVGDPDPVLGGTVPAGGVRPDRNNFGPRIGFAWTPRTSESGMFRTLLGDNDTVIRAGFGVMYGAIIGDTALQQLTAPGYAGTNAFFFPGSGTLADPFAPDPFPLFGADGDVPNQGQIPNPFLAGTSNVVVRAPLSQFSRPIDPNIRTPYTYQYNLTIERAFRRNYVASIAYVGNRGRKLYALEQVNPAFGTFFPASALGRTIPAATAANVNSRRLNDDIRLGVSQMVAAGNSSYDSLQAQVQRRLYNGLLFQVAYTYSKSIADSDTLRDTLDLIDRRFGKSLSAQDIPHRFTATALYDLPFFKSGNGLVRTVLGGWNIGGIYSYQSGTPFSVTNPFDTVGTGGGVLTNADLGAPYQQLDPRKNDGRAFNIDAFRRIGAPNSGFVLAKDFRRGSAPFNAFRLGNSVNNLDMILAKNTRIGERMNLELRFEAFNALNHTQFTTVDLNLGSTATCTVSGGVTTGDCNRASNPNFGKYTGARESRVVQLGARFSF
jgi:Carboxypeptidase regulatory-like domain/TonB dependent receptor